MEMRIIVHLPPILTLRHPSLLVTLSVHYLQSPTSPKQLNTFMITVSFTKDYLSILYLLFKIYQLNFLYLEFSKTSLKTSGGVLILSLT